MVHRLSPTPPLGRQRLRHGAVIPPGAGPGAGAAGRDTPRAPPGAGTALLQDEDALLALWTLQGLAYHGFDGVGGRWEVDYRLVHLRVALEDALERALRPLIEPAVARHLAAAREDLATTLFALPDAEFTDAPSLAVRARRSLTLEQWREVLVLKSAYQLKEADPHTFALPRLPMPAKLAMLEIQVDEYGNCRAEDVHSGLFARAMTAVGLDPTYGAYVDAWPAPVLAANVALGWWASRRDWAGAVAGHLAMIETTSSLPCQQYVAGARRLGLDREAWAYFDEHVEADAAHEQVAIRQMCPAVVEAEGPERMLFGFLAGLYLDGEVGRHAIEQWDAGRSALHEAAPALAAAGAA
ncbi:iron-containing redox enzyme family protein [Kytococcus sedentarius]|nr:iron-containing redox enzyme family protein [Kytococcus sedentarius]